MMTSSLAWMLTNGPTQTSQPAQKKQDYVAKLTVKILGDYMHGKQAMTVADIAKDLGVTPSHARGVLVTAAKQGHVKNGQNLDGYCGRKVSTWIWPGPKIIDKTPQTSMI